MYRLLQNTSMNLCIFICAFTRTNVLVHFHVSFITKQLYFTLFCLNTIEIKADIHSPILYLRSS